MGLFDNFPYTNFHELNLDWILQMLQKIDKTMDEFVAINSLKYADPIQWDITSQYEKNTIVIDPQSGTAYISVQPVPVGVILTNTDYWTVVFDLEQFVTKANNNFTLRVEEQTTLTATFPTPENGWLIWGGVLYKANTNIIAGDQYVVDSNISRITVESIIGWIEDLKTTDKTNLVAAINELYDGLTDTNNNIGDLADLTTTDTSTIVNAINELVTNIGTIVTNIGDLADLNTTDTSSIVNAINSAFTDILNNNQDAVFNNVRINGDLTYQDPTSLLAGVDCIEMKDQNGDPYYVPAVRDSSYLGDKFRVPHHRYHINDSIGDDSNDGLTASTPWKTFAPFLALLDKGYRDLRCYVDYAGTYNLINSAWDNVVLHITGTVAGVTVNFGSDIGDTAIAFYNSHVNFVDITITGLPIYFDEGNVSLTNVDAKALDWFDLNGGIITANSCHFHNIRISGFYRIDSPHIYFDDTDDGMYLLNAHGRISGSIIMEYLVGSNSNGTPLHANNSILFWQSTADTAIGTVPTAVLFNGTITSGTRARINRLKTNYGTVSFANGSLELIDDNMLPDGLYYNNQSHTYGGNLFPSAFVRTNGNINMTLPLRVKSGLTVTGVINEFYMSYVDENGVTQNIHETDVANNYTITCYNIEYAINVVLTPNTPTTYTKNLPATLRLIGVTITSHT